MAKYSTGSSSGGGGDSTNCEMCGKETDDLTTADVAGATLDVCDECNPNVDASESSSPEPQQSEQSTPSNPTDQNNRSSENVGYTLSSTDGSWAEDASYEPDQTPYLVDGYDEKVIEARQEAGMTVQDLAEKAEVSEAALDAVEAGSAMTNGVGRRAIVALEKTLGIRIAEEDQSDEQ